MKAWHVQDINGEHQEIVFAEKRSEAINKSEARWWVDYIDVRAKRAKYADDLENEPKKLNKVMLENCWWFECDTCSNHVDIDNLLDIDRNVDVQGKVICNNCLPNKLCVQK